MACGSTRFNNAVIGETRHCVWVRDLLGKLCDGQILKGPHGSTLYYIFAPLYYPLPRSEPCEMLLTNRRCKDGGTPLTGRHYVMEDLLADSLWSPVFQASMDEECSHESHSYKEMNSTYNLGVLRGRPFPR